MGSFGLAEDSYALELALMIQKKGWRLVLVNRRGWDMVPLKSEKFIHTDELSDFYEAILEIKSIYESPIYMMGVSAGACHGTRLIVKFKE